VPQNYQRGGDQAEQVETISSASQMRSQEIPTGRKHNTLFYCQAGSTTRVEQLTQHSQSTGSRLRESELSGGPDSFPTGVP